MDQETITQTMIEDEREFQAVAREENPDPEFAACRRCGHERYLNDRGWCSPDCERGLTPRDQFAPWLREVLG